MKKSFRYLIIALCVILSCVTLISCDNGSGNPDDSGSNVVKIPYSLSEYQVIRPTKASQDVIDASVSLRKELQKLSGVDVGIKDDWVKGGEITDEIKAAKEILVGDTNRPESAKALEGVDPTSFVITVIDNKIVINAEKTSRLSAAIQFFLDNYATDISDGNINLPENLLYVSDPLASVTFISDEDQSLTIVYLDGLDNTEVSTNENDRLDLDVVYAKELREVINKAAGTKTSLSTDWYAPTVDIAAKKEILVGNTSREETAQFLSELNYNEYGFGVFGNKIIVTGWNETTTELAVDRFADYLKANTIKKDDGTTYFAMLENERVVYESDNWFVDYPSFDAGTRVGTQDAGYGNLQVYYTDTTLSDYDAYCKKLEDAGYKLYMENTLNNNVHKAYTSDAGMLYVYYIPTEGSVRIVSCADGKYNLPQYVTPESVPAYKKIVDSSITQMTLSYGTGNFGLCHIITLEDGSFIVYDGGGNNNGDYDVLYKTLRSLNKRTDGKIVIAAWILTHEHWDHYTNFAQFCKSYANVIELEGLYCNTPSGTYAYNGYNPNYYMNSDFNTVSNVLGGVDRYIVHTGMKFYIRNACVEIIYTQEDLYPTKLYFFNDCTMVSRITISDQTITYLGDVRYEGSDIMCERYGNLLKCDIVQVSHHGYDGGTVQLYKSLNPICCLWPTSKSNFATMSSGSTASGYMSVDTYILYTLKVPTNIIAEPTATIMLPFKTGDKIIYDN